MHSHVCFGKTFESDLKYRITWSISYSPICAVNLISLLILIACFPIFWTTHHSPGAVPTHLLMSSYNPFTSLLSCSSFMHVSRNIVSIDGSISGSNLSLLPKVEASIKLFLASMKVSLVCSKSNYFFHRSLANPSTIFGLFSFIISHHNSTSEHHAHIWIFLTWLRPHHLQVLSRARLERSLVA